MLRAELLLQKQLKKNMMILLIALKMKEKVLMKINGLMKSLKTVRNLALSSQKDYFIHSTQL
jgi:hypothetical protein